MILNYTPLTIFVRTGENELDKMFPSLGYARVEEEQQVVEIINGIEVKSTVYKDIQGLPPPQPNTYYLVSTTVAQVNNRSTSPRTDLLSPNWQELCGDHGALIGVRGFLRH